MTIRTMMAGLAASALIVGSASAALAYPHQQGYASGGCYSGPCYYYGGGYQGIPQDKQDVVNKLVQEHLAQVEPLRQALSAKRLELDALSRNPNVEPETISKLAQEVAELQSQIRASGVEFRQKVQQEAGVTFGMGAGCGNRGMHHARGWHR